MTRFDKLLDGLGLIYNCGMHGSKQGYNSTMLEFAAAVCDLHLS
jgi:hypothetical protein